MTTYTITFANAFPVPPLILTDPQDLGQQVTDHATPHLRPLLAELGRTDLLEAFFHPNCDLRGGWFILPSLAKGKMARFCPARIEEQLANTDDRGDSSSYEADHSDCIQPHRTADGYADCDGRPL